MNQAARQQAGARSRQAPVTTEITNATLNTSPQSSTRTTTGTTGTTGTTLP